MGLTGKLFQTAKWGKCHCTTLGFKVYILRETSSITETSPATPSIGVWSSELQTSHPKLNAFYIILSNGASKSGEGKEKSTTFLGRHIVNSMNNGLLFMKYNLALTQTHWDNPDIIFTQSFPWLECFQGYIFFLNLHVLKCKRFFNTQINQGDFEAKIYSLHHTPVLNPVILINDPWTNVSHRKQHLLKKHLVPFMKHR